MIFYFVGTYPNRLKPLRVVDLDVLDFLGLLGGRFRCFSEFVRLCGQVGCIMKKIYSMISDSECLLNRESEMINNFESGRKLKKTNYRVIIGVLLFVLFLVTVTVNFNEHLALTRVDSELLKKIDEKILSANIIIIPKYVNENQTGYGSPASGVIYQKEGNTYYILTANHTFEGTKGIMIPEIETDKKQKIS